MTSTRLKYVKLTPALVLELLSLANFKVPPDAHALEKMAYDRETGNIVLLIESPSFPEVTGPGEMQELERTADEFIETDGIPV